MSRRKTRNVVGFKVWVQVNDQPPIVMAVNDSLDLTYNLDLNFDNARGYYDGKVQHSATQKIKIVKVELVEE